MTTRFLSTVLSANEWYCTSKGPVWKLRRDQVIDMHCDFCLVYTTPTKWRFEFRAKIGHYRNRCF